MTWLDQYRIFCYNICFSWILFVLSMPFVMVVGLAHDVFIVQCRLGCVVSSVHLTLIDSRWELQKSSILTLNSSSELLSEEKNSDNSPNLPLRRRWTKSLWFCITWVGTGCDDPTTWENNNTGYISHLIILKLLTKMNLPLQLKANFPRSNVMRLGTDRRLLMQRAVPTIWPTTLILRSRLLPLLGWKYMMEFKGSSDSRWAFSVS